MSDVLDLPVHGGVVDIIEMFGREVVACDSFCQNTHI